MTIVTETDAMAQAVPRHRRPHRSGQEIQIRDAIEAWSRPRWPDARIVHELVTGRGINRADMAVIGPDYLIGIEIKSAYDVTERLIDQVAAFSLCCPEVWVCLTDRHAEDVAPLLYLFPHIGLLRAVTKGRVDIDRVEPERAPTRREPYGPALLSLLWVPELAREAGMARLYQLRGKPPSHAALVRLLMTLDTAVEPTLWGCPKHWYTLPKRIRDQIWRTYRGGQEIAKDPSPEYLAAARAARAWALDHERRTQASQGTLL